MKAHQVRELDTNDIKNELANMDEQRFRLKFQMSMGQMDGVKKVRTMRKDKDRARMLTILRERELAEAKKQ
jgi:large subunit ribosomal protein L29